MPSSTRKRNRPLQQSNNSSPNIATDLEQSSANKKRKLNPNASSSINTTRSSGFFRKVANVFKFGGSGLETERPADADETNDELDETPADDTKEDELAADEIEDDNEGIVLTERSAKLSTKSSPPKKATSSPPSLKRKAGRPWNKPNIEDTATRTNPAKGKRITGNESLKEEGEKLPVKTQLPKKLKRVTKYALRKDQKEQGSITDSKEASVDIDPLSTGNERPNREKRQHKRQASDLVGANDVQPKSILTATTTPRGRSRKNVEFETGGSHNLNLGFKDISSTSATLKKHKSPSNKHMTIDVKEKLAAKRTLPKKEEKRTKQVAARVSLKQPAQEDSNSVQDEDVPCSICQEKDSEEPNQIVFCEKCDIAVHQECYGIPIIPEGDWFCRNCAPEEKQAEEEEVVEEDLTADELGLDFDDESNTTLLQNQTHGIENLEHHLQVMQSLLLQKLSAQQRMRLRGHDDEFKKVYQVVEQTVLAGESNSMLVIGARGSGKTTLVETILSDLSAEHREDFHIVRLNGFIHTDDKLALREIWRQLGREMELDAELTSKTNNHADTLASLLALLSHPSELSETDPSQTSKSVIFILDEFDLFATHSRQTLLYNLFDIAQARKAPIAVLGLTTRIDVVEALEKRVKSRFSHRYVYLSLPRNLTAFWDICREALIADEEQIAALGSGVEVDGWSEFQSYWDSMIEDLYTKDDSFKHQLQTHFYRTKSIPSFLTTCLIPIASLTPISLPLIGTSFLAFSPSRPQSTNALTLPPPDSKLHLLPTLPLLSLALLISAARLDIIHDTDTCNFAMAYDEYTSLATRQKIQSTNINTNMNSAFGVSVSGTKIWGREVALGAWERLIECGVVVGAGVGGGGGNVGGGDGKATRMWRVDVGLEEIGGCVEGLGEVYRRWCREI